MEAETEEPPRGIARTGLTFDARITVGNAIQIMLIIVGLVAFERDRVNQSDQIAGQIADLRGATSSGLADIRQQIATLPDQRAALEQTLRRLTDVEQRYNTIDRHLGEVERMAIECRADLNTIMRQANAPLPTLGRK